MTEDERAALEGERFQSLSLQRHQQNTAAELSAVQAEFCEACGNGIPKARRLALPGVRLCIECKRAEELERRR